MKIRVLDVETSGLADDPEAAICETAFVDIDARDGSILRFRTTLVNPGRPMPPTARAVHHLGDADLVGAVSPETAKRAVLTNLDAGDILAAHNAEFERHFVEAGDRPWICTLRCAKHLYPDAPCYSNQVLRYWLGVDADGLSPQAAMPPHRAGPDALVTAYILRRMLAVASPERLVELTNSPAVLTKVDFGKHRGARWSDLPRDYLRWIAEKSELGADEKHTARHHLGARAA